MITVEQAKKQIRGYLVIMVWLAVLTAVEVAIPLYTDGKILVGLLLVGFASVKAGMVGWYYMHLKHEKFWLIMVALCPLIAAMYAGVLGIEATTRRNNPYFAAPARVLLERGAHGEDHSKDHEGESDH